MSKHDGGATGIEIQPGLILETLYSTDAIAARNVELARQIAADKPERLLVVAVLTGSFIFAADLVRALHHAGLSPEVEFVHLSSYRDATVSSGHVQVLRDVQSDVTGRDVLLVDDILDSGRTLAYAKDMMSARGARTVKTCVLLQKPGKQVTAIDADFCGFECPSDRFVVGYGMDMGHSYRELPFIGFIRRANGEILG